MKMSYLACSFIAIGETWWSHRGVSRPPLFLPSPKLKCTTTFDVGQGHIVNYDKKLGRTGVSQPRCHSLSLPNLHHVPFIKFVTQKTGGALSGCKWGVGWPLLVTQKLSKFLWKLFSKFYAGKEVGFLKIQAWGSKNKKQRERAMGNQIWIHTELPISEGSWFQVPWARLSPLNPTLKMRIWRISLALPLWIMALCSDHLLLSLFLSCKRISGQHIPEGMHINFEERIVLSLS